MADSEVIVLIARLSDSRDSLSTIASARSRLWPLIFGIRSGCEYLQNHGWH